MKFHDVQSNQSTYIDHADKGHNTRKVSLANQILTHDPRKWPPRWPLIKLNAHIRNYCPRLDYELNHNNRLTFGPLRSYDGACKKAFTVIDQSGQKRKKSRLALERFVWFFFYLSGASNTGLSLSNAAGTTGCWPGSPAP